MRSRLPHPDERSAQTTYDLLVDVDGVLYPFPEEFTTYLSGRLGRELRLDTTSWEFYEAWGIDADSFVDLLAAGVGARALWWEGAPYPEVGRSVRRLREAGHRLHLVTAREVAGAEAAMEATLHWLSAHDLEVESVNLALDKPTVLGRLGLDPSGCIAVDDAPHLVEAWEGAGVHSVVLDRWRSYRGTHRAVPDLAAFADLVEERSRNSRA